MNVMKKLLKVLLWTVAILVVALLALPLWFGPVVKTAANVVAPKVVKTDFHLGHLSLNPYKARFELGGLRLANPVGYSAPDAVTVGEVVFDAETRSLLTDVIHVEEITVRDLFASYLSGGAANINNFEQIQRNVLGEPKDESVATEGPGAQKPVERTAGAEPAAGKEKKIIIDRLTISGIKIQLGFIPLAVPVDVVMTDIGKDSGGATWNEVWQQILAAVMKSAGAVGDQATAFAGLLGDAAGKATGDVSKSLDKTVKDASKVLNDAAGLLNALGGKKRK